MKTLFFQFTSLSFLLHIFFSTSLKSQNVGIGTNTPGQKLEVNGKIKLSSDTNLPESGTIRYNDQAQDFEGYSENEWQSFTSCKNNPGITDFNTGNGKNIRIAQFTSHERKQDLRYGTSVDIDEGYAVIGAPYENINGGANTGAVYVMKKTQNGWIEDGKITADDGQSGDLFGYSVKAKYDFFDILLVVGCPGSNVGSNLGQGAVYVFRKSGENWTQEAKLVLSTGTAFDSLGYAVTKPHKLNNIYHFGAGAPYKNLNGQGGVGAVYIFHETNNWSNTEIDISATNNQAGDRFGLSIALDSNVMIVGAPLHDSYNISNSGAAYIFKRDAGGVWEEKAEIAVDEPGVIDNFFGFSVALTRIECSGGVCAVIGAPNADVVANDESGKVYVFRETSGINWQLDAELAVGDEGITDETTNPKPKNLGFSVGIYGNDLVAGAPQSSAYTNCNGTEITGIGRIYMFRNEGNIWARYGTISENVAENKIINSQVGYSVGIHGRTIIAGCPGANPNKINHQGKVLLCKADAQRALD